MSLESLAEKAPDYTRSDNHGEKLSKLKEILRLVTERPRTTAELAAVIGNSKTLLLKYLDELAQINYIERIESSYYWRRVGHVYNYDFNTADISTIPRIAFRDIPIIKPWYLYAKGNPTKEQYVNTFQAICYGELAETFTINPMNWQHPQDTDRLYQAYKAKFGHEYPKHVIEALKAFLSYCKKVVFTNSDNSISFYGLRAQQSEGKYRYVKLTPQELAYSIAWLNDDRGKTAAQKAGLELDRLKAHFAYALEGFPRPSSCLTIEIDRIEKHRDKDNGLFLLWQQPETKQGKEYSKFMLEPTLVSWAVDWLEKRRALNHRYLFVDDNDFQTGKHKTQALTPYREPVGTVYKRLFIDLNKSGYFLQDTLYALRHCGVHVWLERTGYNYDWIAEMGWESTTTLRKFYGGLTANRIRDFIQSGRLVTAKA